MLGASPRGRARSNKFDSHSSHEHRSQAKNSSRITWMDAAVCPSTRAVRAPLLPRTRSKPSTKATIGHEIEQVVAPAMRIITGPTVQLGLDLQYPLLRLKDSVLEFVDDHRRLSVLVVGAIKVVAAHPTNPDIRLRGLGQWRGLANGEPAECDPDLGTAHLCPAVAEWAP